MTTRFTPKRTPTPNNAGGHIVTVAIADVAAYVRPGTALDHEAYLRGNSVYFPDRVVPMLPERISNDLCSLKEGENRPSLAVRMVFDSEGRKKRHSFHRVVFRSAAKLSYQQVQAAIDGRPDDKTGPAARADPQAALCRLCDDGEGSRQNAARSTSTCPSARSSSTRLAWSPDVRTPERLEAMRLIEEMMIAANVAAAETLEKHKSALLYRVHDTPSREKLAALRDFLGSLGPQFRQVRSRAAFRLQPRAGQGPRGGKTRAGVRDGAALAGAGEYAHENYGHFGLNLDRYAHFTSPIRPLCRPDRASRADHRTGLRQGWAHRRRG